MKLIWNRFRDAAGRFPKQFTVSILLALLLALMNALVPWGLRQYLQKVTDENTYQVILAGIVCFAVYFLIRILVTISWTISLDRFGGRYIESVTLSLERAMAETSYDQIERMQPGVLRNIMYTDVLNIFRTVGNFVPSSLGALAVMAASLVISFLYEVKMTLFICASILIGLLLSWCSRKVLTHTVGQTNAMLKKHDQWCTQFVDMLPQIQQNPVLEYYTERTSENLHRFIDTSIHEDRKTVFWTGLVNGYNSLFSILLSAVLAIPVAGNSVSNLVFFTMISNLVLEQAQTVEQDFQLIVKNLVSFRNVERVMNLPRTGGDAPVPDIRQVSFDHVSFSYTGQVKAADDICCRFVSGDAVLLKGGNGSGKSTFLKLLTGAYVPSEGTIWINDRPLSDYRRADLNRKILYISQEEKCLDETFHTYLELVTAEHIPEERFRELLRFVELPDDDRKISGNGASLSVGQRKKLLAMKLFLRFREADLIILDELTAGLDARTTEKVYGELFQLAREQGKILLLVDHNPPDLLHFTGTLEFQEGKLTAKTTDGNDG